MKHLALVAALFLTLCTLASGQRSDVEAEYQRSFDRGIEAFQSGELDAGIAAFRRCLELVPRTADCAYNLACGYSLKEEVDTGVEWFGRAVDWGIGYSPGMLQLAREDSDLDNLREHQRFAAHIERLSMQVAEAERYANEPALYMPPGLDPEAAVPLLVVLHDHGRTKESVLTGPWRRVAEELGYALLAPSGRIAVGSEGPRAGMTWYLDLREFRARPEETHRTVGQAVLSFRNEHQLDRERVVIAGDGLGAIVAFDLATRNPSLYRGVVLHDGIWDRVLAQRTAAAAGRRGLKAQVVYDVDGPMESKVGFPPGTEDSLLQTTLHSLLTSLGIESRVRSYELDGEEPELLEEVLAEAVRGVLRREGEGDDDDSRR